MTRHPRTMFVGAFVTMALIVGCGDDTDTGVTSTTVVTTTTTVAVTSVPVTSSSPESSLPTTTSVASTSTTAVPTTTTEPTIDGVVFDGDGLEVVDFGDDAQAALTTLVEILGPPDFDTGWGDPSDEANEPLWPGCPGSTARLVVWEGVLGVVFTDWDQSSDDPRATVATPYLAGAGLWPDSPITTPEGARTGDTVGRLRAIYGDRLSVVASQDGPLPWVFAIDGTTRNGTLDKTGGLRGNIQTAAETVTDDAVAVGFTAGVSCDTP